MLISFYSDSELSNIYNNDPILKQLNENLKNIEENHPIERTYKSNNLFDVVETRGEKGDALYADVMTNIDRRTRQINAELGQCKAENFRIENVRKAVVNGKLVKLFNAYQKIDKAFVFAGQFSAPVKMSNKDLRKLLNQ